ncbi:MAG: hypothetical protein WAO74_13040 [Polaribacter sp.]|uniref:hypothetical protein n=1 Tax=Polaribacter sp. TaxID=1920175 RepID=UPI003BAEA030
MKKFTNKKFLFFITLTLVFFNSNAQSKGDIAIVGYNTDGTGDGFSIVALADIAANSTIYFTDSNWDETANAGAGAFVESGGEDSFLTWGTGASIITAGTIVTFTNVSEGSGFTASTGTLSRDGGNMNLLNAGETVFAYLGSHRDTPTLFLTGFKNGAVGTDLTDTGLTVGIDFIEVQVGFGTASGTISGQYDAGQYNGERANLGSFSDYFATINQPSNWEGTDGGGGSYLPSSPTNFTINTNTPSKGDIAFVGFDTDAADSFAIAALADIPANTTIYFTDYDWDETNSGAFTVSAPSAPDAFLTWNSGNNVIIAGTIIHFTGIDTGTSDVSIGSITIDGTMNLINDGETVFAYLGSNKNTPSLFLTGYKNGDVTTELAGTGLTIGTDFLRMNNNDFGVMPGNGDGSATPHPDQGRYNGSRANQGSYSNYFSIINTASNWDGRDNGNFTPFSSSAFSIGTSNTTFNGNTNVDNDWNNAANWSEGVPTSSSIAFITNGATVSISSGEAIAANVDLLSNSTLSIASGAGLTVTGVLKSTADDDVLIESGGSLILLGNETALVNNAKASLDLATTNLV